MIRFRYVPVVQKPFCCVAACLQMIFSRRQLTLLSQEEIALPLGLIIPQEYINIFPNARTGQKPSSGWGTQIQLPEYSLNKFFLQQGFPIREEYYPYLDGNAAHIIGEWLRNNCDVIVCFNYKSLYADAGRDWGHVSLIDSIDGEDLILIDPEQDVPQIRRVSIKQLLKAISEHGESNRAGFWVISQIPS